MFDLTTGIISVLLFLAASAGHVALCILSLNLWYAQPFPRPFLKKLKVLHAVTALTGPIALWLVYGPNLLASWNPSWSDGWRLLPDLYVLLCWIVELGVVPATTLLRGLTPRPSVLRSNHSHVVDVARALGFRPAGQGKRRHLALLPGNQVFQVEFAERTLHVPGLPTAWDGLTILHLTDLHLNGSPDKAFFQHVMDLCRAEEPDLVAITGDIVDSHQHHRWVVPVLGRLRWRIAAFGILGNHDYWHEPLLVRRRLRKLGIRVLGNSWEQIEVRGQPLVVIGHEGPWFQPVPDLTKCPPPLVGEAPHEPQGTGVFRLCLSHTPDNIAWARRQNINLMLAGHNHGGQIRLPLIGSLFVPSRYSRRYDCGTFHEPPTILHVGRGLAGQEPLRYNCRPEVTRIVLKADHFQGSILENHLDRSALA